MIAASRAIAVMLFVATSAPLVARAQSCVPDATPDWMESIPLRKSSARVLPPDCATVEQTPPDFSWPDLSADARYEVTLVYPDGRARTLTAPQNWINWDEVLPAGSYTWRVRVTDAGGTLDSRLRHFTVQAGAVPFLVPDWTVLFDRAAAKAHPRALPDAATAEAMLGQRQVGVELLRRQVDSMLGAPLPAAPTAASPQVIEKETLAECSRTLDAAVAWIATSREEYFAETWRRAQNLASWDPHGSTAYASVDQASRAIASTLTLVYDWLFQRLDVNQKSFLLAPIVARSADMYDDIIGSRARVAIHPPDSHANQTLTDLAVISVVLAGDAPQALAGVRDALPLALHSTSPWGGEDGGFANGTAYATWTIGDLLVAWYVLRWTIDVDIARKAWVRNHGRYLAYFIPPGTPSGVFGDGAEMALTENWARFGKAYALFVPRALARWYAAERSGEDPSRPELLLAPPADSLPAPFPAGVPDAALFPSIGWTAMHSRLPDPARVSVYFKASPYGSYNHSHAAQNSFVISAGGERLAIDSGYFDDYKSPHWREWYKQTQAHNAITFDGGQGQVVFEHTAQLGPGAITAFVHQSDHDIVQGDATAAYGDALSEAQRALVYLRPHHILVYDRLASDIPRRWEWNIHAPNAMNVISDRSIAIQAPGATLCVDMLAGPPMQFTQTDQFVANPSGAWTPQWHGVFGSASTLAAAEFIALLRVGCEATTASASKMNGVWKVEVNDRIVTIGDSGVTVE